MSGAVRATSPCKHEGATLNRNGQERGANDAERPHARWEMKMPAKGGRQVKEKDEAELIDFQQEGTGERLTLLAGIESATRGQGRRERPRSDR